MIFGFPILKAVFPVNDLLKTGMFLFIGPVVFFMLFNSKMVVTNRRIIKDSWLFAEVVLDSYANVKRINVDHDVLTLDLVKGDYLHLKSKHAAMLKEQIDGLITKAIAKKDGTQPSA